MSSNEKPEIGKNDSERMGFKFLKFKQRKDQYEKRVERRKTIIEKTTQLLTRGLSKLFFG